MYSLVWRWSPSCGLGQSSVYVNLLARHVGSVGRCQKGHHACHFFRLPKPRKRHRSPHLLRRSSIFSFDNPACW